MSGSKDRGFSENKIKQHDNSARNEMGDMLDDFLDPQDPGTDIGDLLDEVTQKQNAAPQAHKLDIEAVNFDLDEMLVDLGSCGSPAQSWKNNQEPIHTDVASTGYKSTVSEGPSRPLVTKLYSTTTRDSDDEEIDWDNVPLPPLPQSKNPDDTYNENSIPPVPPRSSRPVVDLADSDLPPVHRHLKPKPGVPAGTRVVAETLHDSRTTQQEQPSAHDDDDNYGPLPPLPRQPDVIPIDSEYETGPRRKLDAAHAKGSVTRGNIPSVPGSQ